MELHVLYVTSNSRGYALITMNGSARAEPGVYMHKFIGVQTKMSGITNAG